MVQKSECVMHVCKHAVHDDDHNDMASCAGSCSCTHEYIQGVREGQGKTSYHTMQERLSMFCVPSAIALLVYTVKANQLFLLGLPKNCGVWFWNLQCHVDPFSVISLTPVSIQTCFDHDILTIRLMLQGKGQSCL